MDGGGARASGLAHGWSLRGAELPVSGFSSGGNWIELRLELKRLASVRIVGVMQIFGWYERSVGSAEGGLCELSIAAELLDGGSLLERAAAAPYSEWHVRQVRVARLKMYPRTAAVPRAPPFARLQT